MIERIQLPRLVSNAQLCCDVRGSGMFGSLASQPRHLRHDGHTESRLFLDVCTEIC